MEIVARRAGGAQHRTARNLQAEEPIPRGRCPRRWGQLDHPTEAIGRLGWALLCPSAWVRPGFRLAGLDGVGPGKSDDDVRRLPVHSWG